MARIEGSACKYSGPYGFVGEKYDEVYGSQHDLISKIDKAYWALGISGGCLDQLYQVMLDHGVDFGGADRHVRKLPTDAGAEEYYEIMADQELMK